MGVAVNPTAPVPLTFTPFELPFHYHQFTARDFNSSSFGGGNHSIFTSGSAPALILAFVAIALSIGGMLSILLLRHFLPSRSRQRGGAFEGNDPPEPEFDYAADFEGLLGGASWAGQGVRPRRRKAKMGEKPVLWDVNAVPLVPEEWWAEDEKEKEDEGYGYEQKDREHPKNEIVYGYGWESIAPLSATYMPAVPVFSEKNVRRVTTAGDASLAFASQVLSGSPPASPPPRRSFWSRICPCIGRSSRHVSTPAATLQHQQTSTPTLQSSALSAPPAPVPDEVKPPRIQVGVVVAMPVDQRRQEAESGAAVAAHYTLGMMDVPWDARTDDTMPERR